MLFEGIMDEYLLRDMYGFYYSKYVIKELEIKILIKYYKKNVIVELERRTYHLKKGIDHPPVLSGCFDWGNCLDHLKYIKVIKSNTVISPLKFYTFHSIGRSYNRYWWLHIRFSNWDQRENTESQTHL